MSTQVEKTETSESRDADAQDEQLGEGGKKALIAERDARKAAEKTAAELQAQIDALNSEKMSDLEKAQAAAEAAQKEAEKSAREALRYRYAAKYGISDDDAALFLTGETEDVVKAQAERLAATVTKGGTPKPDLTQGGSGTTVPQTKGEMFADFIESKLV